MFNYEPLASDTVSTCGGCRPISSSLRIQVMASPSPSPRKLAARDRSPIRKRVIIASQPHPPVVATETQSSVDKAYDELCLWSQQPPRRQESPSSIKKAEGTKGLLDGKENNAQSELFRLAMLEQSKLGTEATTAIPGSKHLPHNERENSRKKLPSPKKQAFDTHQRPKVYEAFPTSITRSRSPQKPLKTSCYTNKESRSPQSLLHEAPGTVMPFHDCIHRDPVTVVAKGTSTNGALACDGKPKAPKSTPLSPSKRINQITSAEGREASGSKVTLAHVQDDTGVATSKLGKGLVKSHPKPRAPPGPLRKMTQFDRIHSCLFDSMDVNGDGVITKQEREQESTTEFASKNIQLGKASKEPDSLDELYKTVCATQLDSLPCTCRLYTDTLSVADVFAFTSG